MFRRKKKFILLYFCFISKLNYISKKKVSGNNINETKKYNVSNFKLELIEVNKKKFKFKHNKMF